MISRCGLSPSKPRRCGAITAHLAIVLTALLGLVAIVADGGILLSERRHAQATADAAVLSAAADLFQKYNTNGGVDGGSASTSATTTAASNGYKNDASGGTTAGTSTVTVRVYPNSKGLGGRP
jgi:uncharacterized membrane protein